jgi:hypothetical protein
MRKLLTAACVLTLAAFCSPANAALITFDATLNGAQEPTASTATGFGTVVLDDVADMITVNLSWTGLVGGPATAAHIHGPGAPGVNAPVLFPFSGVPSATSGSIPQQSFGITTAEIAQLEAGLYYMNIHNSTFPAGEIRGQLLAAAPEPSSLGLIVGALALIAALRRAQRPFPRLLERRSARVPA